MGLSDEALAEAATTALGPAGAGVGAEGLGGAATTDCEAVGGACLGSESDDGGAEGLFAEEAQASSKVAPRKKPATKGNALKAFGGIVFKA